jgi:hypothetical protein
VNAIYYAKGMCRNCYHQWGREKKPTKCEHTSKPLYAKGVCKQCYLRHHYVRKDTASARLRKYQETQALAKQLEKDNQDKVMAETLSQDDGK